MAQYSLQEGFFERKGWQGRAMSEEEYHELEQLSPDCKYEYIDGRVYMMSGGSVAHDLVSSNVRVALNRKLRPGPCRAFGSDVQVLVGRRSNGKPHYLYPDTTVSYHAADGLPDNTLVKMPRVVVEVLSPGTEYKDRNFKFKAYQHCPSIQEIVLIGQYAPHVEIYQRNEEHPENPKAWHRRLYGPDEAVELFSLGLELTMAEIYEDLSFREKEVEDNEE